MSASPPDPKSDPANYIGTENITVLLVDDDPAILEGVVDLLEFYGYEVLTAGDGQSALDLMGQRTPDLVISDIMMPEMDGFQFYEEVRKNPYWVAIPFIFLTARGQPVDVRRGQSMGADAYLIKPFEPEDLIIAIQARLKRVREIQAATQAHVEGMKQQLMNVFSHELRTPLTYIYGYVSLLQEGHTRLNPQMVDRMLDGVRKGADRLVNLVEDLILLVRIDSGVLKGELDERKAATDMGRVVGDAAESLALRAVERQINLDVQLQNGLQVSGIDLYLVDVFKRLIDNAIKFTPKQGGAITIRSGQDGDHAWVTVQDQGVGISRDDQKRIFERFVQINRAEQEQQGIGLGLSLARELTALHGGRIEVSSEPGQGSTFTVWLPLVG